MIYFKKEKNEWHPNVNPEIRTSIKPNIVRSETAAGTVHTAKKGPAIKTHQLYWHQMSKASYDALVNFLINVVRGASFDYYDNGGTKHIVHWWDESIEAIEKNNQAEEINLTLREELA